MIDKDSTNWGTADCPGCEACQPAPCEHCGNDQSLLGYRYTACCPACNGKGVEP